MSEALLDTNVFISAESGRRPDRSALPERAFVSVITVAELELGVLASPTTAVRARRLATLQAISVLEALPVDLEAARRWAELRQRLWEAGRRMNVNDLWIGAIAAARGLPVATQDADFDALEAIGAIKLVRL